MDGSRRLYAFSHRPTKQVDRQAREREERERKDNEEAALEKRVQLAFSSYETTCYGLRSAQASLGAAC
jgi:hypothetical protein